MSWSFHGPVLGFEGDAFHDLDPALVRGNGIPIDSHDDLIGPGRPEHTGDVVRHPDHVDRRRSGVRHLDGGLDLLFAIGPQGVRVIGLGDRRLDDIEGP